MQRNKKNITVLKANKYIILPFTATILCMLAIFMLSAQPATESNNNSKLIVSKIVDSTSRLGADEMTESQKTAIVEKINSVAREFMHSAVYFIMAIFAQITMLGIFKEYLLSGVITFTFCEVYAFTDELHQLLVPGRTFQLLDLGMDAAGILSAILLVLLIHAFKKRRKAPITVKN
ncbi:VanZ family protein [Ruminiclostridium sufflavum DSM 19573]|uniref:VanZ family protein n=1 Tax=Ruminiclostridium sufflavum DSM 19573 TaxID=1121337 RepID=A0A318Y6T3_9FIRM|nr:VanZ family protein [Ruminiclostridium sufflavum]PYG87797.1 VanZ family protein [Ruminiclostridium sufflavum DSM 19573]